MTDAVWNSPYQAPEQAQMPNAPATLPEQPQATPLPPVVMVQPPAAPAKKTDIVRPNRTGAGFLADLIRSEQARIKAQLAKAGEELKGAMVELGEVANEATNHVKAVKQETADLRASLGLTSNGEEK